MSERAHADIAKLFHDVFESNFIPAMGWNCLECGEPLNLDTAERPKNILGLVCRNHAEPIFYSHEVSDRDWDDA